LDKNINKLQLELNSLDEQISNKADSSDLDKNINKLQLELNGKLNDQSALLDTLGDNYNILFKKIEDRTHELGKYKVFRYSDLLSTMDLPLKQFKYDLLRYVKETTRTGEKEFIEFINYVAFAHNCYIDSGSYISAYSFTCRSRNEITNVHYNIAKCFMLYNLRYGYTDFAYNIEFDYTINLVQFNKNHNYPFLCINETISV